MRYLKNRWVLRAVGPILFCIILYRLDLTHLVALLSNINILYLVLAIILFIPLLFVKAWRWQLLMRAQDIRYSLPESITMYAAAVYVGNITPGRLGDFIKVLYLIRDDHPFGRSFVTVLLDKLFDLASLFLLAYASMLLFITLFEKTAIVISLILAVILLLTIFFICKKEFSMRILERVFSSFIPLRYRENAKAVFSDFGSAMKKSGSRQLVQATLITFLGWIIYFLAMYLLALALGINIPFFYLVICASTSALVASIPISISGIGTRDAMMVLLFSYLGLNQESAIAFSISILFVYVVNGLIGLLAWLKKPVSI